MGTEDSVLIFVALVVMLALCWRPIVAALAICLVGVVVVGIVQVAQWLAALS